MTWGRLVLHLVRKDIDRARILLGALGIAALAVVLASTEPLMGSAWTHLTAGVAMGILAILCLVTAVQSDPLWGPRAAWRALPVTPSALLAAKGLFVLVVAAIQVAALELAWALELRPSVAAFAWEVGSSLLAASLYMAVVAALAVVTPHLRGFVLAAVGLWLGLALVTGLVGTADRPPEALEALEPARGGVPPELRLGDVEVWMFPGGARPEHVSLNLRRPERAPADLGYVLVEPRLTLGLDQDEPLASLTGTARGAAWNLHTPALLSGDSVRWLGPAAPVRDILAFFVPMADEVAWDEVGSGPSGLLEARIEVLRPTLLARAPLGPATLRTPQRLIRILDSGVTDGQPSVRIRLREGDVDRRIGDRRVGHHDHGEARRQGLAFALYNPGQREALLLEVPPRSSTPDVSWPTLAPPGPWLTGLQAPPAGPEPPAVSSEWLEGAELLVFEWTSVGAYELGPVPVLGRSPAMGTPTSPR